MIVSSYYNKENDVVIASTSKQNHDEVVTEGNVTYLKKDGETIAVNIFNPTQNLECGLVDSKLVVSNIFGEDIENPFEVGKIESLEKHPKSEKLNVCQVKLSSGVTQIVCGASNVSEGIKVVVAKVGSVMPTGVAIVPSKLIDVPSNGMICSLKELGKEQSEPGIVILSNEFEVGQDYL